MQGEYDLKKARYYYEQAIAVDPRAYETAWYQLGRIDFLEGEFDAALYKFNKQIEYFPDGPARVYYMIGLANGYKARATKRNEDWDAAAAGFIEYLKRDSGSPWARTDLSWVYFAQGKYAQMRPVLELGLVVHPEHPWLLNMYGLYLLNVGREDEASAHFDRALAAAEALTVDDWGAAYPGNNPLFWDDGLTEFRDVIEHNRTLIAE
jgi:tetratricopeptide (TPR) repeat protein